MNDWDDDVQPPAVQEACPGGTDGLLWVLWHYQGGHSPVGQPIRAALGIGQFDRLTESQLAAAKRYGEERGMTPGAREDS